jgi:hypothetical protein
MKLRAYMNTETLRAGLDLYGAEYMQRWHSVNMEVTFL